MSETNLRDQDIIKATPALDLAIAETENALLRGFPDVAFMRALFNALREIREHIQQVNHE